MKSKRIAQIATALLILAALGAYFFIPSVNSGINTVVGLFASGDTTVIKGFVESYGTYAMAVSFLLMIFQSVMAPLPAFLITFTNANLFGWWKGAILSWSSAMAGAVLCFYIARIFGREVTERFTTKAGLSEIDNFFDKYGVHSILIARLLPFISFDIVSYAAGLTSIGFWAFFIATGVGQLPATLVYSYVGGMLTGGTKLFVTGLLIIFALFTLVVLLKKAFGDKIMKRGKADIADAEERQEKRNA